ncbi:GNAT family N-acetyltransferase [Paenibacillus aceris]|uniref:RimJ/RimL family protein N-acetyltransferase n=1 Tax=Paenibacillus aceris TaxID=869555 RepID=A0ABS4HW16_9BACL|nr:GNAT family N-acetyltransferase [Paenibacillus aceris]MBP1962745.1 RimJ/RimL family protein N-acetyltransferase [Paenibacillus aceris]NHW33892.1 GNAT family N-acetyltransferase [Paenibacillus aceris]
MKAILREYKQARGEQISSYCLPIIVDGKVLGRLKPLTIESIENEMEMKALTEWRAAASMWFATQFPATEEGTKAWVQHQIIEVDDRILFILEDEEQTPIGQIGLKHYDETNKTCEYDNLLRGRKGRYGNIVLYALLTLGAWSLRELGIQKGYLNVLSDNARAIQIYKTLGAVEVERRPLRKEADGEVIRWIPAVGQLEGEPEREMVTMVVTREAFIRRFGDAVGLDQEEGETWT